MKEKLIIFLFFASAGSLKPGVVPPCSTAVATPPRTPEQLSWWSGKVVARQIESGGRGRGMFACAEIGKDELIAVFAGKVITTAERIALATQAEENYAMQIEDDLSLHMRDEQAGVADFVNHSCDANAGIRGQIMLVAMRDIALGEEVCFDYCMTDSSPAFHLIGEGIAAIDHALVAGQQQASTTATRCMCGSARCRGTLSGNDWQREELQQRYAGYFSDYLQRRINARNAEKRLRALAS